MFALIVIFLLSCVVIALLIDLWIEELYNPEKPIELKKKC